MVKKIWLAIHPRKFGYDVEYVRPPVHTFHVFGLASRTKIRKVVVHAEEANARQTGPHAVSAHVGQVSVFGGGSSLSFPPLSFVFEGVSPVLFKL